MTQSVAVEQPQSFVQPLRSPSFPTEAPAFPGSHQMSPHFHFHPPLNELEAPARVANGEVVHPAAQYRVDVFNHPLHGLGSMSPEDFSKRLQQHRAFLQLGRILRSPSPRQIADATEVKPQEPKTFASGEVNRAALLFVDLDKAVSASSPWAPMASSRSIGRDLARKTLVELKDNKDPLTEKARAAHGETVKDLCEAYLERYAKQHKKTWRDDASRIQAVILKRWGTLKINGFKARRHRRRTPHDRRRAPLCGQSSDRIALAHV